MTAEPALTTAQDERLREMARHVQALDLYEPAELAELLASPALEAFARRVVEAVAALQVVYAAHPPDIVANRVVAEVKYSGAARKISVQQRVGPGKFSQYVTGAVSRQLEMDLLAELSELLAAEHGPVSEQYLAEARAAWPDGE
jgi:hypothetical protein